MKKGILLLSLLAAFSLQAGPTNAILFVTQVPVPGDFTSIASTFGNQRATPDSCGRGGDLYIRYTDGTLQKPDAGRWVWSVGLASDKRHRRSAAIGPLERQESRVQRDRGRANVSVRLCYGELLAVVLNNQFQAYRFRSNHQQNPQP